MGKTPVQPADAHVASRPSLCDRWHATIDTHYSDLVALVLCFVTGLCDSSAYNAWACFLAMQTGTPSLLPPSLHTDRQTDKSKKEDKTKKKTGNTVFLGLGASNQPSSKPWGWLKSLVSILAFFTGATGFSTTMRILGPRRRGTLFLSFLAQTVLLVIAVALIQTDVIPHDAAQTESLTAGPLFLELVPIALLAFQSAGAMAATRALGFNEIPSVVLTSVYFDLGSDPGLLRAPPAANVKRNRRAGAVVLLLAGAIAGGWLSRSPGGMESALWISAGIKALVGVGWLGWRREETTLP